MHPLHSFRPQWILSLTAVVMLFGACGRESGPTDPLLGGPSLKPVDPSHPIPEPARKLAFYSDREFPADIYVMNSNGSGQINLTGDPADGFLPSWSPDGKKIAFLRTMNESPPGSPVHLMAMNPDGTGLLDLTGTLGLIPNDIPQWSPDGSTIAFTIILESGGPQIWQVHPDGTGLAPVTSDGFSNRSPEWSPDGTQIVYTSSHPTDGSTIEDRGIYVIAPDGAGRTQLTANPDDDSPTWSPNGAQIAFVRGPSEDSDIFVMSANGSGATNLTNQPARYNFPSWSPDGSRIAFSSNRTGSFQIFTMDGDGGSVDQLTTTAGESNFPVWSPDGVYIAFHHRVSPTSDTQIWRMGASGTGQIQLTTLGNNLLPTWKGMK